MSRLLPFLLALAAGSSLLADDQAYTAPQLFSGTLYLSTVAHLDETQSTILNAELDRTNNAGSLIAIGPTQRAESSVVWKLLRERKWSDPPTQAESQVWSDDFTMELKRLRRGSCLWIDANWLDNSDAANRRVQSELLQEVLHRGVLVIVDVQDFRADTSLADGWNFLPDIDIVLADGELVVKELLPNRARLKLTRESLLRIGRRELVNISDKASVACQIDWPATDSYKQPVQESIPSRAAVDLTAARRALKERQQPAFPGDRDYHPELKKGGLVIIGGGGCPTEIWEKFVELAGGKEARIVVLPTAVPEPEYEEADEVPILKRYGAQEVRVLRQTSREDVSKPEFLNDLRWATGVWFGGGRQWRFVDAYWGTPAWEEIKQVVARGGAIAGSSAGATIQGDLLVRGHPLGNQIMVADGYRRGLGLLEGVAIDQHFKQRNRFDDLLSVAHRFPKIIGIGIDESTALVVEAPNRCSVIGKGSVWVTMPNSDTRKFVELPTGESFELKSPSR